MSVPTLSPLTPSSLFQSAASASKPTGRLDTKVGAIAVSNEFSGNLTVTTAEGDKVTFTANLEEQFRALTYQAQAEQDGVALDVRATTVDYSLSRKLGLTIEGDLNEQEVKDLTKLFRKVVNIFKKYIGGEDEAALAKTAKLADRFSKLSSLSSLDLSVDVERSVTVVAAQLAAQGAPQAALPTTQPTAAPASTPSATATPGETPQTAAAIPQSSTGTTASTQPAVPKQEAGADDSLRLAAPPAATQSPKSLVEQVLEAVRKSEVEARKLRKYVPRLLDRVREELEQERGFNSAGEPKQTAGTPVPSTSALVFAYQSYRQTSITLSIRS